MAKKRRIISNKVKTSPAGDRYNYPKENINPLYPLYEKVDIEDVITSADRTSVNGVIENIH
jgi:hypothetical protein